ncbi:hypothetical protein SAMN05414139_10106 [Burkholderia sp. D7]|nr:hypothetical protein SAMN05414139_10106 [Burkholderia sp. D7]
MSDDIKGLLPSATGSAVIVPFVLAAGALSRLLGQLRTMT